jgi:transcription elongation GreA/GreB family factor
MFLKPSTLGFRHHPVLSQLAQRSLRWTTATPGSILRAEEIEMSVAFRRESDEEHKEPKFELPLPPGPNLVTARGLAQIEARVAALQAAIATEAEDDAREMQKRELRYWNTRHATAVVAPLPEGDEVAFGTRVVFRLNGERRVIDIVGSDEAEPTAGRIAFTAPLAHAMMNAEIGERIDFNGTREAIEIVEIGPQDEWVPG